MKKIVLLTMLIALIAPLKAHALVTADVTADDVLSYAAMPLAVSNVCDVRGVQTDEVGNLVAYMDRADVSPEGFIDVFRYVPVALVLNNGGQPDFVRWVGGEVDQGIVGDQLVSAMENRLTTYGNVVRVSDFHRARRHHHRYYRGRIYATSYEPYQPYPYDSYGETDYAYDPYAFEPDYVPVVVQHYCDHEILEPLALIDQPIAVADVVDIGVPIGRIGSLMVQLDLGYVPPLQTVEILRYAPAALLAPSYYGQPDFVQYVYDQRVNGVTGYNLVLACNRQLPAYGVAPQIDISSPVYVGQNQWVPNVVQNYVPPADPAYVPPVVRTQVAAFAPSRAFYRAPSAPVMTYAPPIGTVTPPLPARAPVPAPAVAAPAQVQRLFAQQGNPVVVNPGQARREIAASMRARRVAMPSAPAPSVAVPTAPAPAQFARGPVPPAVAPSRVQAFRHAPVQTIAQPSPATIAPPQPMVQQGRPQFARQRAVTMAPPRRPVFEQQPAVVQQQQSRPQFRRPVMATPTPPPQPQMIQRPTRQELRRPVFAAPAAPPRPQMIEQARPQFRRPVVAAPPPQQQVIQQRQPQFVPRPQVVAPPPPQPQMIQRPQRPQFVAPPPQPQPQVQRRPQPQAAPAVAPQAQPQPQGQQPAKGNGNGREHKKGKDQ